MKTGLERPIEYVSRGAPFAGSLADYLSSLLPSGGISRDSRSVVYFVGADDGPVKIGSTVDPAKRLTHLQCGSPVRLSILAALPGGPDLERAFHQALTRDRLHGEWFNRGEFVEAEIRHWRAKKRRLSCVAA